jgi:DNA helicase II / ATP-dependent DNA helicase PcrA
MQWDEGLDSKSAAYGIASATTRFVRVVAGPGTGKSFALKRRVARLLEEGIEPARILPVTFTNVAAEDLQREMLRVGVAGCEEICGSTLHSLCMRILSRQHVLEAIGRTPRPLNRLEMEPLLYDLPKTFGNKRDRSKRIRAYEAAWARLQHEHNALCARNAQLAFRKLDHRIPWGCPGLLAVSAKACICTRPKVFAPEAEEPSQRDPILGIHK